MRINIDRHDVSRVTLRCAESGASYSEPHHQQLVQGHTSIMTTIEVSGCTPVPCLRKRNWPFLRGVALTVFLVVSIFAGGCSSPSSTSNWQQVGKTLRDPSDIGWYPAITEAARLGKSDPRGLVRLIEELESERQLATASGDIDTQFDRQRAVQTLILTLEEVAPSEAKRYNGK